MAAPAVGRLIGSSSTWVTARRPSCTDRPAGPWDQVRRFSYAKDLEHAANPPSGRECGGPAYTPPTGSDVDVYVDGGDDVTMPDGALTGGYCARTWWC